MQGLCPKPVLRKHSFENPDKYKIWGDVELKTCGSQVHYKQHGKWVLEGLRYDGKCCCGRSGHVLSLTKSSSLTDVSSKEFTNVEINAHQLFSMSYKKCLYPTQK